MASSPLPPPPSNNKDDEQVPITFPPANAVGRGSKPGNCLSTGSKLDMRNGETVKSTPPSSGNNTEAANKRKREPAAAGINDNEEKKLAKDTPVADTTDTREINVPTVETAGVKEVEMKDAEAIDGSHDQGIKEVEMQDAEVEEKRREEDTDVREGKMHPGINKDDNRSNLNATEGCKQDQATKETGQPRKLDKSESNEKRSVAADTSDGIWATRAGGGSNAVETSAGE